MKRLFSLMLFSFALLLNAQDFPQEFDSDFSNEDSGDSSFSDDSFGDDSFGDDSFADDSFADSSFFQEDSAGGTAGVEIGGSLKLPLTLTMDQDSPRSSTWHFQPVLETSLNYQASKADLSAEIETGLDQGEAWFDIDEAWLRLYLGSADLEAGLIKLTWGKGDQMHVMDVLNPMDYSRFIEEDYNDRKEAEMMMRLNIPTGMTGKLELVAIPWFTPDSQAMEGPWVQSQLLTMTAMAESTLKTYGENYLDHLSEKLYSDHYADYYSNYLSMNGGDTAAADASAKDDIQTQAILATLQKLETVQAQALREENTRTLEYAQGGFRFTHSLGPLDWGISLIRSYMDSPVIELVDMNSSAYDDPSVLALDPHVEISYTPLIMAAQEAAWVTAGFNFRQEAAFFMTEDWEGDDPALRNPKVEWLFGFDRNLPLSKLNLNVQGSGSYILLTESLIMSDPDYAEEYYTHRIAASLSDSWFHDQLTLNLAGSYNVEDQDFLIMPELEYLFKDEVRFSLLYRMYQGEEDTLFGQFDDHDSLTLTVRMDF